MIEFVFDFPGKTGLLLVTAALSVIVIAHHYYKVSLNARTKEVKNHE